MLAAVAVGGGAAERLGAPPAAFGTGFARAGSRAAVRRGPTAAAQRRRPPVGRRPTRSLRAVALASGVGADAGATLGAADAVGAGAADGAALACSATTSFAGVAELALSDVERPRSTRNATKPMTATPSAAATPMNAPALERGRTGVTTPPTFVACATPPTAGLDAPGPGPRAPSAPPPAGHSAPLGRCCDMTPCGSDAETPTRRAGSIPNTTPSAAIVAVALGNRSPMFGDVAF